MIVARVRVQIVCVNCISHKQEQEQQSRQSRQFHIDSYRACQAYISRVLLGWSLNTAPTAHYQLLSIMCMHGLPGPQRIFLCSISLVESTPQPPTLSIAIGTGGCQRHLAIRSDGNVFCCHQASSPQSRPENLQTSAVSQVDASGTLEAIRSAVAQLPQEPVSVRFLHSAAGPVTQADVDLAASTQGIILAFNTRMQVRRRSKYLGVHCHHTGCCSGLQHPHAGVDLHLRHVWGRGLCLLCASASMCQLRTLETLRLGGALGMQLKRRS